MNAADPSSLGPPSHLTEQAWWDAHWNGVDLPAEVTKGHDHSHDEILAVIERFFPRRPGLKILEVGGAPGQYLAYMHRTFGYDIHLLDYSPVGCAKSKRNFDLLGLPVTLHQGDFFALDLSIGTFDIVYSLGFIEHFTDLESVIERHCRLLKPGGLLLVGCPNFRGINGWFLKRLAPDLLSKHNLAIMDLRNWAPFERALSLQPLFTGYVGGFEPNVFNRREDRKPKSLALKASAGVLARAFRPALFKTVNSPAFSHYVMGVYRTPSDSRR